MITWNLLIVLLSMLIFSMTSISTKVLDAMSAPDGISLFFYLDRIVGLNYGSATHAFNFLRDVFVCAAILPILLWFLLKTRVWGLGFIWLAGLTVGFDPIVIREHILMFFVIGVLFSIEKAESTPQHETVKRVALCLLLVLAVVRLSPQFATNFAYNVEPAAFRLCVATVFIYVSSRLAMIPLGNWIAKLEPSIYLVYLSHTIVMMVLWGVWQQKFGNHQSGPYLFFFLFAPIMSIAIAIAGKHLLDDFPPIFGKLLLGRD